MSFMFPMSIKDGRNINEKNIINGSVPYNANKRNASVILLLGRR